MAARVTSIVLLVVLATAMAPAFGQDTGSAISALSEDSLYVEAGADAVDEAAILSAISTADGHGVDLRVAVLAAGNAEQLASTIAAGLDAATVLVFTPTSFGAFSDTLSQGRLDDALGAAADELSGADVAAGVGAFADGLDPDQDSGGVSTGLVVVGIIGLLVVVGVGGRIWEVRTRDARQVRRRDRRRSELMDRTRSLADRVLELSDPVELADDGTLSKKYADAAARFDEAELAITEAKTMHELDTVEERLAQANSLLDEIRTGIQTAG
ncbi:MAG: hypothetical protein HKN80_07470 [Acidimicrobiia bacterium]|nr:hypothetical protein [Acidimicrobiia bacterium]